MEWTNIMLTDQLTNALTTELEVTTAHLEFEQLSDYVLGKLDELTREIADNHLATCEFCAGEIHALTALQTELHGLASSQAPEVAASVTASSWQTSLRQLWGALWGEGLWTSPAKALAMSALLLTLSVSGWWWWQVSRSNEGQTAQTQPQSEPSQLPATAVTPPNETSTNPATAPDLLALSDHGLRFSLRQDGSLNIPLTLPAAYEAALKSTLTRQRLSLPEELKRLTPLPNTLKSAAAESDSFQVIAPVGQVLETTRPVFHWHPQSGATQYSVSVFDEDFNAVLTSPPLTQTSWQADRPLPRGRLYLWQVSATVGEQQINAPQAPAPEARFQILTKAKADELQRARREFSQSHLLLGTLYAEAGLLDEAERELRSLQRENPKAPIVAKLLRQVRQTKTTRP